MDEKTLPQNLAEMLEISNPRATYQNQLRNAREMFESRCHLAHGGGFFKSTPVLIAYLYSCSKFNYDHTIVEDQNGIPILIEDLEDFLDTVESHYYQALNSYWEEVQRLRKSRNPSAIVEAEL